MLFSYILVSHPMHFNALSSKIELVNKSNTNILLCRQSKKWANNDRKIVSFATNIFQGQNTQY